MTSLREMSQGRPTQPFYLETSILFFFEQLNKAGIYIITYTNQSNTGVSDMRRSLSNYSKSLKKNSDFVHSFHVKKNIYWTGIYNGPKEIKTNNFFKLWLSCLPVVN